MNKQINPVSMGARNYERQILGTAGPQVVIWWIWMCYSVSNPFPHSFTHLTNLSFGFPGP